MKNKPSIFRKKFYCNPIFGSLLILNDLFPAFSANAMETQPVQPMAQTADQVVDALDAVDAGVSVHEAFLEQPTPFREYIKFNKTIYNTLFNDGFAVNKAGYYLTNEINESDVFLIFWAKQLMATSL